MKMNEYQERAKETAVFPKSDGYMYLTLGLCNEVGEVAGKVKKNIRGDYTNLDPDDIDTMVADELGDVLWYLAMLSKEIGYTLEEIAQMNLDKLSARKARNTIKGSGDER